MPLTLHQLANKKNSVVLALTIVAAGLFAVFLWFVSNHIRRVAFGPVPVTVTELSKMGVEAAPKWFDVTAEVKPSHLLQTTTKGRGGTTVTNHFVFMGDNAVVVETSETELPPTFPAWAQVFDQNSDYYKRARRQLDLWTGSGRRVPLSPLLLKTSGGVASTQSFTAAAIAVVAIVLFFFFWRTTRALQDFTRTAPIARLQKSVRASEGLPNLIAEIDRQLAALDPKTRRRGPLLLPSWLLKVSWRTFSLISSSDVIWVAPFKTVTRLYAIIPISKRFEIHVLTRYGQTVRLPVSQDKIPEVLTTFYHWAPWAVIGPDPTMADNFAKLGRTRMWGLSSTKRSRAELIQTVDKRREEIFAMRAAQPSRSPWQA